MLNYGIEAIFEEKESIEEQVNQGYQYGLAFAINNFFDKETTFIGKDKVIAETNMFDHELKLKPTTIAKPDENGQTWIRINTGLSITASELVGSEALDEVVGYLRDSVGSESAAGHLGGLASGANVIDAISTSIAIVSEEIGSDAAKSYVGFLNASLAPDISYLSADMSFQGWSLEAKPVGGGSLKLGNAEMDARLEASGHQSLYTRWADLSVGAETERQIDLTDLYEQFKSGAADISSFGMVTYTNFQRPSGNLVNSFV
jgi:hypothetical protein